MAEAGGLNPLQHGFESHRGHCIGLLASARADRARESADFVVARRRRGVVCSLRLNCSLRSLRLALVGRCLPHSLADERRVCSLARPGQRRASLAQHGGARSGVQLLAPCLIAGYRGGAFPVPGRQTWLVSASDTPVGRRGMGNADRAAGGLLNKAHSCFKAGRRGPCPAFQ